MRLNVLVNVHTTEFVVRQLRSLQAHALPTYQTTVVFSCSTAEVRDAIEREARAFDMNIVMNPEIIPKRRHHGSILRGICSNLRHAPPCDMTLVLSSRSVLRKTIDHDAVLARLAEPITSKATRYECRYHLSNSDATIEFFRKFEGLLAKDGMHVAGAHEGLMFDGGTVDKIRTYLENSDMSACFNASVCAEEYVLQTIAFRLHGSAVSTLVSGTDLVVNVETMQYTTKLPYG